MHCCEEPFPQTHLPFNCCLKLAGSPEASHNLQDSAPAAPSTAHSAGCAHLAWRCPVSGGTASVLPAVYDAVHEASGSCTFAGGQALCGCYVLDIALYQAITAGACSTSCEPPAQQGSTACTVGLLDLRPQALQHGAPTCAPAPQPGCAQWQYACGALRVSERLYAALQAQQSCAVDLDPSSCIVGR